jgi:subtilisin family serine protease
MAAPHATGIAALLIEAYGGAPMAPSEVKRLLAATADDLGSPGHDPIYGGGRVHSGFR